MACINHPDPSIAHFPSLPILSSHPFILFFSSLSSFSHLFIHPCMPHNICSATIFEPARQLREQRTQGSRPFSIRRNDNPFSRMISEVLKRGQRTIIYVRVGVNLVVGGGGLGHASERANWTRSANHEFPAIITGISAGPTG